METNRPGSKYPAVESLVPIPAFSQVDRVSLAKQAEALVTGEKLASFPFRGETI